MVNHYPDLAYLASPYAHRSRLVRFWRFLQVVWVAGLLMSQGHSVFSPIAHSYPISILRRLPGNWGYWEKIDKAFLFRCSRIYVLCIDGWRESVGVKAEIDLARVLGLPITYIDRRGRVM